MSKQRDGAMQIKSLSTSDYNRHFLPTLSQYKSLSSISQALGSHGDLHHLQYHSKLPANGYHDESVSRKEPIKISRLEQNENDNSKRNSSQSTPSQTAADDILVGANSNQTMVNSDFCDKKKDRKSQARRHLVEGLSTSQQRYNGPNRIGIYRSQTFNQSSDVNVPKKAQRSPKQAHRSSKEETVNGVQNHKGHSHSKHGVFNATINSNDRTKAAIENWNELILEINAHQYANNSKHNHLSVLSDSTSSLDDFAPFHTHPSKMPRSSSFYTNQPMTIPGAGFQSGSALSNKKFTGLGFTRYRPITPNLLERLDKLKLSSRKKTQRWVNQLQVQRRSFNMSPKATLLESDNGEQPTTGIVEEISTKETCVTSTLDTLKPLKRTDSYDSSRLSSFAHAKKQQPEFL